MSETIAPCGRAGVKEQLAFGQKTGLQSHHVACERGPRVGIGNKAVAHRCDDRPPAIEKGPDLRRCDGGRGISGHVVPHAGKLFCGSHGYFRALLEKLPTVEDRRGTRHGTHGQRLGNRRAK